jgi:uncharacterized protein DUF935
MTDLATQVKPLDPVKEYVAGSVTSFQSARQLRGLPHAFDDLSHDFGDDIYERMQLDPQVRAVVNTLISGIIEEGAHLECPIDDDAADGYELGHEIEAFCTSVLSDLVTPLDDVLWDMCAALPLGSRVAEEVYTFSPASAYSLPDSPTKRAGEFLVLSALKVKPRQSVAFVVDAFMNVIGLLGRPPVGTGLATTAIYATDPRTVPNLLPRDKFAVLSFRPVDGDPRGTSVIRPGYTPWWTKQQIYPEFLKYLAQFASPSVYATASEDATKNGVRVANSDGTTSLKPAVEVLLEALLSFQNGTALAVPYGTILDALQVSGNGEAFHAAFTHCDQQIALAVLHQTLATLEAQHQSRASSETHQDTLDTIVRQAKRAVALMLRRDVLRPMVAYNYGDEAAKRLTPTVSLGSVERQDLAAMMTAIAQLSRAGYLDASQLPAIDAQLNLPVRAPAAPADPSSSNQPPTPPPDDQADEENDNEPI